MTTKVGLREGQSSLLQIQDFSDFKKKVGNLTPEQLKKVLELFNNKTYQEWPTQNFKRFALLLQRIAKVKMFRQEDVLKRIGDICRKNGIEYQICHCNKEGCPTSK
ncbi:MAG: hypothetical protein KGJ02_04585 [Verrucomicrobiota bacterium]|nr:hypothetical protein [Verrucomicrobiota bacterium]